MSSLRPAANVRTAQHGTSPAPRRRARPCCLPTLALGSDVLHSPLLSTLRSVRSALSCEGCRGARYRTKWEKRSRGARYRTKWEKRKGGKGKSKGEDVYDWGRVRSIYREYTYRLRNSCGWAYDEYYRSGVRANNISFSSPIITNMNWTRSLLSANFLAS
eukprot:304775-Pleurochrysis_carterae.AAC.4